MHHTVRLLIILSTLTSFLFCRSSVSECYFRHTHIFWQGNHRRGDLFLQAGCPRHQASISSSIAKELRQSGISEHSWAQWICHICFFSGLVTIYYDLKREWIKVKVWCCWLTNVGDWFHLHREGHWYQARQGIVLRFLLQLHQKLQTFLAPTAPKAPTHCLSFHLAALY